MIRPAGCERHAKCARIGSANREVKETGGKGFNDGQYS
jgi:hypothetical protein